MVRLHSRGPVEETVGWREKAVNANRYQLAPCDKLRVQHEVALARSLYRVGRREEALKLYDNLIASKSIIVGSTCFARTIEIKYSKAKVLAYSGRQEQAKPIVLDGLRELRKTGDWGAGDYWAIWRARFRMLAVAVLLGTQDIEGFNSIVEVKRSITELEKVGLGASFWAGELWRLLGNILRFSGKRKDALIKFEKSIDIYKACCSQSAGDIRSAVRDYGDTLREIGLTDKAAMLEKTFLEEDGQDAKPKNRKTISRSTLERIHKLISVPIEKCPSSS